MLLSKPEFLEKKPLCGRGGREKMNWYEGGGGGGDATVYLHYIHT